MRRTIFSAIAAVLAFLTFTAPLTAGDRVTLGFGRLMHNDQIGDAHDRWRSGSGVVSWMRGPAGTSSRPAVFGELIEYRWAGAVIAPASLTNPAAGDRPFAGIFSFGLHTHFTDGPFEGSVGVDLVATGPQTGMAGLQSGLHDLLGERQASPAVLAGQIPNAIHPTALVEAALPLRFSERLTLRPFIEAQAGIENFVRVGGDLLIGRAWQQGVFLRDTTSGLFYQSLRGAAPGPGLSLLVGADTAYVFSSALLPAARGYQPTPLRNRVRLGLHLQGQKVSIFYGLAWLGREFEAQPEGQLVGALRIDVKF